MNINTDFSPQLTFALVVGLVFGIMALMFIIIFDLNWWKTGMVVFSFTAVVYLFLDFIETVGEEK